jgi:hypothetical protein
MAAVQIVEKISLVSFSDKLQGNVQLKLKLIMKISGMDVPAIS